MLFGDAAVGKMTVGQELSKLTGLQLFHNHMTIEPVLEIFGYFHQEVILQMRKLIFEAFAKDSTQAGMIFTYMFAFDEEEDWKFTEEITAIFKKYNSEIYYVELDAPLHIRLQRNETENRLQNKPSKQNILLSKQRIIQGDKSHRFISYENEIPFKNYLKIDNSHLSAQEVAAIIKNHFKL